MFPFYLLWSITCSTTWVGSSGVWCSFELTSTPNHRGCRTLEGMIDHCCGSWRTDTEHQVGPIWHKVSLPCHPWTHKHQHQPSAYRRSLLIYIKYSIHWTKIFSRRSGTGSPMWLHYLQTNANIWFHYQGTSNAIEWMVRLFLIFWCPHRWPNYSWIHTNYEHRRGVLHSHAWCSMRWSTYPTSLLLVGTGMLYEAQHILLYNHLFINNYIIKTMWNHPTPEALTLTKISWFIHVCPYSIILDLLMKVIEHLVPVQGYVGVKEIREIGISRPNKPLKSISLINLHLLPYSGDLKKISILTPSANAKSESPYFTPTATSRSGTYLTLNSFWMVW